MLGLNKKKKKKPVEKCKKFTKAKEISKQYEELSNCCKVLSDAELPNSDNFYRSMHSGGWRIWTHTITGSGIDIEDVYCYIKKLAVKRKAELECELAKLDV